MRGFERLHGAAAAAFAIVVLASADVSAQQNREDAEARLRSALRSATVQLRQMEDQFGALQAKQTEAERDRQALAAKLEAAEKELDGLHQRVKSGESALQQSSSKLQTTSADLATERARLAKSQDETRQAAEAAREREAEVKRLDATLAETRKRALTAEEKNAAMYRVGLNLIDLYDRKGVLETLVSKDPITQLKRVDLENIIQNYKDKLSDARVVRPQ